MNTTESNRTLVRDAFARWEAGDFSAVLDLMAEDLEWTIIGSTAISGTYASRDAFQDAVGNMLRKAFKGPIRPTIHKVIADGSDVAVLFESHAETHAGPDYDQACPAGSTAGRWKWSTDVSAAAWPTWTRP